VLGRIKEGPLGLYSGVILDESGNLYGTTLFGGINGDGLVYELSPQGNTWTETVLHEFSGPDGRGTYAGLIFDKSGNLFGATNEGGFSGGGTIFELSPQGNGWTLNTLYQFPNAGEGPYGSLVMDKAGNLYGVTQQPNFTWGTVFELSPSNGGWIYTELYDFAGDLDGGHPYGSVLLDNSGNIYGTTNAFGMYDQGTVYKVTPN